jgi:hypothetical protein
MQEDRTNRRATMRPAIWSESDPNRNIALMLSCEHQAPQLVGPRLLFDHLVCEREQRRGYFHS